MGNVDVGVIMGSESDFDTVSPALDIFREFEVRFEALIVSAHRTPDRMFEYAKTARARGLSVIVAAAGGAAHLPGMVAALTDLPVLGIPVRSQSLSGVDSLLSIVQMPAGVPTATFAIGTAGAKNAAHFALRILSLGRPLLAARIAELREAEASRVIAASDALERRLAP